MMRLLLLLASAASYAFQIIAASKDDMEATSRYMVMLDSLSQSRSSTAVEVLADSTYAVESQELVDSYIATIAPTPNFPNLMSEAAAEVSTPNFNQSKYVSVFMGDSLIINGNDARKPILFTTGLYDCVGIIIYNPQANGTSEAQAGIYHFFRENDDVTLVNFLNKFDPKNSQVYITSSYYSANIARVDQALEDLGFTITGRDIPDVIAVDDGVNKVFFVRPASLPESMQPTAAVIDSEKGAAGFYRRPSESVSLHPEAVKFQIYPFIEIQNKDTDESSVFIDIPSHDEHEMNIFDISFNNDEGITAEIIITNPDLIAIMRKNFPDVFDVVYPYQMSKNTRVFSISGDNNVLLALEVLNKQTPLPPNTLQRARDLLKHFEGKCPLIIKKRTKEPPRILETCVNDTWSTELKGRGAKARINTLTIICDKGEIKSRISTKDPELIAILRKTFGNRDHQYQMSQAIREFTLNSRSEALQALEIISPIAELAELVKNELTIALQKSGKQHNLNL